MSTLKPGISAYVPTRNCVEMDYCFVETVTSLLPIADEVVICDSESTDGTLAIIADLIAKHPNVRLVTYSYQPAVADRGWYDRWLNFARSQLRYSAQLQMDADEVLGAEDHDAIRTAALAGECRMLNDVHFFRDARHTVVRGHGKFARLAPTECYMPSHGSIPEGHKDIRAEANQRLSLGAIYHYGMLRHRDAFFAKQRFMLKTLEGTTDAVLEEAEKDGKDYMTYQHNFDVRPFTGQHPQIIRPWLLERGWSL